MAKALSTDPKTQKRAGEVPVAGLDWRKKVSDHVAYGLLVYTGLHIFGTMTQLKHGGGSVMPYFALVVLVAAIIPGCRWLEQRWDKLSDADATDVALAPTFKREMGMFWACVIGMPLVLILAFKAVASLF